MPKLPSLLLLLLRGGTLLLERAIWLSFPPARVIFLFLLLLLLLPPPPLLSFFSPRGIQNLADLSLYIWNERITSSSEYRARPHRAVGQRRCTPFIVYQVLFFLPILNTGVNNIGGGRENFNPLGIARRDSKLFDSTDLHASFLVEEFLPPLHALFSESLFSFILFITRIILSFFFFTLLEALHVLFMGAISLPHFQTICFIPYRPLFPFAGVLNFLFFFLQK